MIPLPSGASLRGCVEESEYEAYMYELIGKGMNETTRGRTFDKDGLWQMFLDDDWERNRLP